MVMGRNTNNPELVDSPNQEPGQALQHMPELRTRNVSSTTVQCPLCKTMRPIWATGIFIWVYSIWENRGMTVIWVFSCSVASTHYYCQVFCSRPILGANEWAGCFIFGAYWRCHSYEIQLRRSLLVYWCQKGWRVQVYNYNLGPPALGGGSTNFWAYIGVIFTPSSPAIFSVPRLSIEFLLFTSDGMEHYFLKHPEQRNR